jgi:hypothetical protein
MTKYRSDPMGIKVKFADSCTRVRVSSVAAREPSTIRRWFAHGERESCGYAASRGFQRLRFRRGAGGLLWHSKAMQGIRRLRHIGKTVNRCSTFGQHPRIRSRNGR